ncbi:EAL domain-containing protein, partial [Clostridium baratii]
FISKTDQGEKYIKILKAIVYICHILDLPVIAEGVETFKQLELLKNLDVDYIQGYIFSKPLSEDDAYNLVI